MLILNSGSTTTISTNNTWFRENARYATLYVQNDYRIRKNLTLNLGLRWEYDRPYAETRNQYYTFKPNIIDPNTGKQGGIEFAGYNGNPHNLIGHEWLGFLPRIGFNYHPLPHTVIRGGFGLFELPGIGFGGTALTSKSTVSASFTSPDSGATPAYQLQNGVPAYSPNVDANGNPNIPTSLTKPSSNVAWLQQNASLAYFEQWQFGVQLELGRGWVLELNYLGNHGVHLPITLAANQIAPTANCCFNQSVQSLRPYPQFLNVTQYVNGGAAKYNALLAQLTHRWSHNLSTVAAYTYQKQMDDVDAAARADAVPNQNTYNLHAQWGTDMTDIPQRFSLTAVYGLPIGAGSKLHGRRIHVDVKAQAREPIDHVDIVANGKVVQRWKPNAKVTSFHAHADLPANNHSWIAARCFLATSYTVRLAHSSPVYLDGKWDAHDDALYFMQWIDDLVVHLRSEQTKGLLTTEQADPLIASYLQAKEVYAHK